ncbi:MAG TPA: PIN domain-containing protein [Gammaproteobacteria bacterium]|nr:PIN domain-containing protein [Gammaproteobacteria bacterium]
MKVVVDTPIWSYALRSKKKGFEAHVQELEGLISDQRVIIIGPIRQEILSGYSDKSKFEKLNNKLQYFDDFPIVGDDYIQAANFSNLCRSKGVQGSHIDFLICAVASRLEAEIFTTDKDFIYYGKHIPIKLFALNNLG